MNHSVEQPKVDFIALPGGRRLRQIRLFISQPKLREEPFEAVVPVRRLMDLAKKYRDGAQLADAAARHHATLATADWEARYLNPNPNEEECAFCRAMARCPAAIEKVRRTIIPFGAIEDLPATDEAPVKKADKEAAKLARRGKVQEYMPRDLKALNEAMKAAGFVEDWRLAVRAEAERVLLAGHELEDFGLELGRRGNRAFSDPEAATNLLRKKYRLKLEDVFNMKLKTPTQLEELTKPGFDEETNSVTPPVMGEKRWAQVCALVTQGDPKPSVKPKVLIKKPYEMPEAEPFAAVPDDGEAPAFGAVPDEDEPMW